MTNYNELFAKFQHECYLNNHVNFFRDITFADLVDLNYLLDRLVLFVENIGREELENYEFGDQVYKLYELVEDLFMCQED